MLLIQCLKFMISSRLRLLMMERRSLIVLVSRCVSARLIIIFFWQACISSTSVLKISSLWYRSSRIVPISSVPGFFPSALFSSLLLTVVIQLCKLQQLFQQCGSTHSTFSVIFSRQLFSSVPTFTFCYSYQMQLCFLLNSQSKDSYFISRAIFEFLLDFDNSLILVISRFKFKDYRQRSSTFCLRAFASCEMGQGGAVSLDFCSLRSVVFLISLLMISECLGPTSPGPSISL